MSTTASLKLGYLSYNFLLVNITNFSVLRKVYAGEFPQVKNPRNVTGKSSVLQYYKMEIGFQPKLEQYKFQCVDFSLGCSHKR